MVTDVVLVGERTVSASSDVGGVSLVRFISGRSNI